MKIQENTGKTDTICFSYFCIFGDQVGRFSDMFRHFARSRSCFLCIFPHWHCHSGALSHTMCVNEFLLKPFKSQAFFYVPWNPIESFSVQFPWASFLFWIELMDVLGYQWYHHFQSLVASSSHPGRKLALPLRWTLCLDWTVRLQLRVWSEASGFWGPGVVAAEGASNDIWGSTIKMEEISYRR